MNSSWETLVLWLALGVNFRPAPSMSFPGEKFSFSGDYCLCSPIGKGRGTLGSLGYLPSCGADYSAASSVWCNPCVKQGAVVCKTAHLVEVEGK